MNFAELCTKLCEAELRTAHLMNNGVAFFNPPEFGCKAYYVVFSHEGDLIDYLTVFEVEGMVKKVKDFGGKIGCIPPYGPIHQGYTLAWEGEFQEQVL